MAKKKKTEPEDDDLGIDEFDDIEDGEIEIAVPSLEKKPTKEGEEPTTDDVSTDEDDEEEEIEDYVFEIEDETPPFKFVHLDLEKGENENDYILSVDGQSHGFCNIFVKHLLEIEGVNIAAYKVTRIEPPKIFIRLESGKKIKEIIHKGIEALREEVSEVEQLFQKLF